MTFEIQARGWLIVKSGYQAKKKDRLAAVSQI
jgi:hypothetical protein